MPTLTTTPPRQDVRFRSGDADCAAWLYPAPAQRPAPIIVLAHGLGGVKEIRLAAFAERFHAAGLRLPRLRLPLLRRQRRRAA
ncbi:hypothetical protein LRS13_13310 [Svornostia abyssi]|uniref:Alpha/beta hydrolase n=1 Tax=Svornostia abyssi TaxID=2898438 RepID=A0ABY5PAL0_9ACTN|nr:hypothetical protein LRS13_13310 [Parviterribacteraceae bacterium J379]